jgi:transcriptional regulator with XRE-family HTH domain
MNNSLSGNKIRQIRKALGLTQRVFADDLGITYPYLSDLEREKKTPSAQLVNLILTKSEGSAAPRSLPNSESNEPIYRMLAMLQEDCRELKREIKDIKERLPSPEEKKKTIKAG